MNQKQLKRFFGISFLTTLHAAVATINADGSPHITPIGSMFLTDEERGFFIDIFPTQMRDNLKRDPRATIMVVNAGKLYWFFSLLFGRFFGPPAVRLRVRIGDRRPSNADEQKRFKRRIGPFRFLPGGRKLWHTLKFARDITIDEVVPIRIPTMRWD